MIFSSRRGRITDAAHPATPQVEPDSTVGEVAGCLMPEAVRAAAQVARLVVVSRQRCHLCVLALETLDAVIADGLVARDQLCVLDVDADDELTAAYTAHVPVVYLDGRLLAYWQLPADTVRSALADGDWTSPPAL